MKKTKRFVDFVLVLMLSLVILGMSEVVAQLVYKLPLEGMGWKIIQVALVFELQIFSIFLWIEAALNARPLGKGFWKRIRKNLLEEMCAARWIMITALVALVVSSLTSAVFLYICALVLYIFKITPGPFLLFMCSLFVVFLLIAIDMSVASWIQNKCKKEIHK